MGTNYYLYKNTCTHCGRGDYPLHIGKSSGGWCFSLNTHPDDGILSLEDWKQSFAEKDNSIKDEYGEQVTSEDMLSIITQRSGRGDWVETPVGYESWNEFHRRNHSLPGPNGLLRHQMGGMGLCIAHGEGTYDIMRGEFS